MPDIAALIQTEAERLIADAQGGEPPILFLSGPQGSGKTTLAKTLLDQVAGSVCLSLDDFYLSKAERQGLAEQIHPLFETRGPPGTHHVEQLINTISDLQRVTPERPIALPVFDKRTDDVVPRSDWRQVEQRPSIILLEGWLLGVTADPNAPWSDPINEIEALDAEGIWRGYQEAMLATNYADLWSLADRFIYLETDDFANIYQWRAQQEEQTLGLRPGSLAKDRHDWLKRFIAHYERLTRRLLAGQRHPGHAIKIDVQREVIASSLSYHKL